MPQFPQPRRGAGPPDSPAHRGGGPLTPREPFGKDVAFHEMLLAVVPPAVTSRVPVGGVCIKLSFQPLCRPSPRPVALLSFLTRETRESVKASLSGGRQAPAGTGVPPWKQPREEAALRGEARHWERPAPAPGARGGGRGLRGAAGAEPAGPAQGPRVRSGRDGRADPPAGPPAESPAPLQARKQSVSPQTCGHGGNEWGWSLAAVCFFF